MMTHSRSAIILHAVMAALWLSGCIAENEGSVGASSVSLEAPKRIRQVSAVDPNQLSVELLVNNQRYNATRQSDGSYIASVTVPANRDSRISVVWTELYEGIALRLAEQNRVVSVGDTEMTVILGDSYVTTGAGFDFDNDGFSNLAERTEGTDPLSADDRPDSAAVQLAVALPDEIVALGDSVSLNATLNDEPVVLQRVGAGVATATVSGLSAGTEALFDVRIEGAGLQLAIAQKSTVLDSGDSNMLTVSQADFDLSVDNDEDGITNIIELLRGTNPRSTIDYRVTRVNSVPLIDGSLDDAIWVSQLNQGNVLRINRLILPADSDADVPTDGLSSTWAAVTDGDTLFIAMRIIDNIFYFDSDREWFRDDTVEIFIDGDNSKQSGGYDGDNDFHLAFRLDDQRLIKGARSLELPSNVAFELSTNGFDTDIGSGLYPSDLNSDGAVDTGYNLELALPLDDLEIDEGDPFGINVHFNDDDNGGDRDAKYAWIGRLGVDIDFLELSALATALIEE